MPSITATPLSYRPRHFAPKISAMRKDYNNPITLIGPSGEIPYLIQKYRSLIDYIAASSTIAMWRIYISITQVADVYALTLKFTHLYRGIRRYTDLYAGKLQSVKLYRNLPKYVEFYPVIRRFA